MNTTSSNKKRVLARFLTALGLGVWLGGIAFAGACAPLIFKVARENNVEAIAPQAFGLMLQRLQIVALACALLALIGWLLDRPATPGRAATPRPSTLWRAQGLLTIAMLAVTLFMAGRMLPRMNALQRTFLPQFQVAQSQLPRSLAVPKSDGSATRREFDGYHALSTRLTMAVFWMGLAALGCFALRNGQVPDGVAARGREVAREEVLARV